MSGFTEDKRRYSDEVVFELTSTKAGYWHRFCGCGAAPSPASIALMHAVPAGFEIVRDGGSWVALRGPGIAERKTAELYTAISGRDISEVDDW